MTQRNQDRLTGEPSAEGLHGGRAAQAQIGQQTDQDREDGVDQAHAPAHPAQRTGQADVILPQRVGRRLDAGRTLHGCHHLLDVRERAGKARRQMIGQQAERAMTLRAIPARNPRPRGIHPLVGAVAGKPAASLGMQGATRQACIAPALLGNVVFAGLPRVESKLHRHPARVGGDLRGPSYLWRQRRRLPPGVQSRNLNLPDAGQGGPGALQLYPPRGGAGVDSLWTSDGPCGQRKGRCPHSPTAYPPPPRNTSSADSPEPFGPDALRLPKSIGYREHACGPNPLTIPHRIQPIRGDPV